MKQLGRLATILTMVAVALFGMPALASAAEKAPQPVASTSSNGDVGTLAGCNVTPKGDLVNIRRYPRTSASRIGILYAPRHADALCDAVSGGTYTACGGTSSWWVPVNWNGARGYVAWRCVHWYVD
ncbi:MAG: hypothetical protein ACRDUA_08320 [Micromonosporaceae bacterium]